MRKTLFVGMVIVLLTTVCTAWAQENIEIVTAQDQNETAQLPSQEETPPLTLENQAQETASSVQEEQAPQETSSGPIVPDLQEQAVVTPFPEQSPVQAQPAVLITGESPTQNKISLDIKGMDIVDVLKMLANRSGMNIVVGKNVTGRVTLFLKNVDVWDAFELILLSNELAYEKKGDILNVMTQSDYELQYGERFQDAKQGKIIHLKYTKAVDLSRALSQIKTNIGKIVVDEGSNTLALIDTPEKIREMEDFIVKTDLPLQTKVFTLNYAKAEKLSVKIQEMLTKGIGSLRIDERTNKIVVTDYPEKLDEVSRVVAAFDEKTQQVLIDAQIIEIRPSDKFEMGVDWDYWLKNHFRVASALPIGTANRLLISTAVDVVTGKGDYKAILDVLRTIGDTKILSSPRIMALNNQEAKILVGTKDAYITSTTSLAGEASVSSQTVNFVDVGIKLYVTPTINNDGFVTMKIRPEISSSVRTDITAEGKITQIPIVTTSEAETTVMIKDGVTIIIGGLQKDEKNKTVKKIPLLGDIPGVGFFFRSTSDETKKTEIVILLTPHIISGESPLTDFSEIKPEEGIVVKMEKGKIVSEKIPDRNKETKNMSVAGYYDLLTYKINALAYLNQPKGEKGEVKLTFILTKDGILLEEPIAYYSNNFALTPGAIRAIQQASPFAPFPKAIGNTKKKFKITLLYQ
ncbi:MAG: secretin N-terminal domain-containing protein [Candidatus Omnitrophica bacterium]|nr:secretin N-terminal domain-containing protein [Candidatus Omnitrophota bacterium]